MCYPYVVQSRHCRFQPRLFPSAYLLHIMHAQYWILYVVKTVLNKTKASL